MTLDDLSSRPAVVVPWRPAVVSDHPSGPLLTPSAPHPPWWQPRVTGSRHSRGDHAAILCSLAHGRAPASAAGVLPFSRGAGHRGPAGRSPRPGREGSKA